MRVNDGENPTINKTGFGFKNSSTESDPAPWHHNWKEKISRHWKENWVKWLFGFLGFITIQVFFAGFIWIFLQISDLKTNYATLDERSKNAQSSLINEINCKNNVLVDCYGKCTLRQVIEKQHACEPTK